MEQELTAELQKEIETKVTELKGKNPKLKHVYPLYVFGDEGDEKDVYIAYFRQPSLIAFSKYLSQGQNDQLGAARELAKECFLDGDKELIKDESLFAFGLAPVLPQIVQMRKSGMANFSRNGK